jgi:hypothetical protein
MSTQSTMSEREVDIRRSSEIEVGCEGSGKFTIRSEPEIDEKVTADLARIRECVLGLLDKEKVLAIILTGGFGRGEGSVLISGNGVRIVNDYDIAVVPRSRNRLKYAWLFRKYHRNLEELADTLGSELSLKQVDITVRPHSYFQRPAAIRIENYEVLHGHRLLYGAMDPCDWMPRWKAADLPLSEGTWLFRNRGLGLLLAKLYLADGGLAVEDAENFFTECNKARLAMGDAVLLLKGAYSHLYSERLRAAQGIAVEEIPCGRPIIEGYCDALKKKLRPETSDFIQSDAEDNWADLARQFQRFFLYFESRRMGRGFPGWLNYSEFDSKRKDRMDVRMLIAELLRARSSDIRGSWARRVLVKASRKKNIALIGLLLSSAQQFPERTAYLQKASKLLGVRMHDSEDVAWRTLTIETLRLIHPGGEVGRLLKRFASLGDDYPVENKLCPGV